jgi:integrase
MLRVQRQTVELGTRPSDRALADDEVRALWQALARSDNLLMAGTLKLRLLTGQRTREVARMRWEDIRGALWQLPAELAKNGRAHNVPLSPMALAVLEELRPITGTERWAFDTPSATNPGPFHAPASLDGP